MLFSTLTEALCVQRVLWLTNTSHLSYPIGCGNFCTKPYKRRLLQTHNGIPPIVPMFATFSPAVRLTHQDGAYPPDKAQKARLTVNLRAKKKGSL